MNVRLDYESNFPAVIVNGNKIYPNIFNYKLTLITNSDDEVIQNIAFDRVKFLLAEVFNNSIILNKSNPHYKFFQTLMSSKIVALPHEPYDQIIGLALFSKINAIMDNQIVLVELSISSLAGGDLWYNIDSEDDLEIFKDDSSIKSKKPWWLREDIQTSDDSGFANEQISWADLTLSWDIDENEPQDFEVEFVPDPEVLNEINEKVPTKPPKERKSNKKKFSPTIITGGQIPDEDK